MVNMLAVKDYLHINAACRIDSQSNPIQFYLLSIFKAKSLRNVLYKTPKHDTTKSVKQ